MKIIILGEEIFSHFIKKNTNFLNIKIMYLCIKNKLLNIECFKSIILKTIFTKNLRNIYIIDIFMKEKVDLIILFKYGLIIPERILNVVKFGTLNIHPSNLPRWRGANPLRSHLLSGLRIVFVEIFMLSEQLDKGKSIIIKKIKHNKLVYKNEIYEIIKFLIKRLFFIMIKRIIRKNICYARKITGTIYDYNVDDSKELDLYLYKINVKTRVIYN